MFGTGYILDALLWGLLFRSVFMFSGDLTSLNWVDFGLIGSSGCSCCLFYFVDYVVVTCVCTLVWIGVCLRLFCDLICCLLDIILLSLGLRLVGICLLELYLFECSFDLLVFGLLIIDLVVLVGFD